MRKRRRVIPSRWDKSRAQIEGSLNRLPDIESLAEVAETGLTPSPSSGSLRTRALYQQEEAARER